MARKVQVAVGKRGGRIAGYRMKQGKMKPIYVKEGEESPGSTRKAGANPAERRDHPLLGNRPPPRLTDSQYSKFVESVKEGLPGWTVKERTSPVDFWGYPRSLVATSPGGRNIHIGILPGTGPIFAAKDPHDSEASVGGNTVDRVLGIAKLAVSRGHRILHTAADARGEDTSRWVKRELGTPEPDQGETPDSFMASWKGSHLDAAKEMVKKFGLDPMKARRIARKYRNMEKSLGYAPPREWVQRMVASVSGEDDR